MARLQPGSGNFRLEGIRAPIASTDAANKAYVDAASAGIPAYANSTAYSVGTIVISNDILYRVNTAVPSSNTSAPASNSSFTRLTNTSGGSGSGVETYANSTAYSSGTIVYYATDRLLYHVRTAVTDSNTTPPSTNSSFEKVGFLTTAEGESLFQPLVPQAEALLSTLPTGNREVSARAQQGAVQIRSSSNINSTTPSWGFYDNLDFGNFPASTEVYSQLTSSTTWANLFNGSFRYLALNFGAALPVAIQSALFSGSVNETPIELLAYVDSGNYAIWQIHGYSGGAEGNLFYMGLKQPTLITSQGTVGTSNVRWMFNITTASNPVISQFSQQISDNEDILLSNNRWGKAGSPQILDGAITAAKLDAPVSQSVTSPLTVDHGGISQDTEGRFRLSPAFTDSAGVLALDMGYVVTASASQFASNAGTNGQFFFSTNSTATDIATLLANDAPADWGSVRSIVMARDSNDSPSRSIAGLVNLLNVGSILEVHTNQGSNMAIWTITGVTYVGGDSNINTHAIIFRVENTPRIETGHTNSYGVNPVVGLREELGSINLTPGAGYGIVIHGEDKVKDGTYLLPGSVTPRELTTTEDIGAGRVLAGLNSADMSWLKNIEGIYQGTWQRINREGNSGTAGIPVGNIAFLDSYVSAGSGTGHFSSAGDAWSSVNYLAFNAIEYVSSGNGEDSRIARSRLKNGSHIKVVQNGTGNYALFRLGNTISQSNWNDYWAVTVVASNGNIPSQSTDLTVYISTAVDNVIANDHLTDNSIGGQKLNITDVTTRTTNVLYRNEDNGRLEQGEYALFASNVDGVVPNYAAASVPNWNVIHADTTVKTDPLAYDTSGNNLTDNTRSWQVTYAGNVQTTRPSTWIDVFGDPDVPDTLDDVITFEDNNSTFAAESAAGRNALIADNAVNRNGVGARVFVYTDKDNWAYVQLTNNSHSVFQSTTFANNTFLLIESSRVGGSGAEARSVQVIAEKGVPGDIATFVFPRDTSGNLLSNLIRIGGDDDVLTTNGWEVKEEYNHSDPVQIFALWSEGEVVRNGVTYNSNNLPTLVRKEIHVGDSVLQYTGLIVYNSSNLPTSTQIYSGDFTTAASLQASHLIATKTIAYNSNNLPTGTTIT